MTDVVNDIGEGRGRVPPPPEENEDDDAALETMMAFQQEQEEEEAETANRDADAGGGEALIPPEDEDDDDGEPDLVALGIANADADNPAAVALANRRAQNLLRQRRQAERFAGRNFLARLLLPRLHYARLSILAAFLLIHHTLRTRQQVYLALVYLQSSKLAYIVLGNAVIASATGIFSVVTNTFLDGGLRANEREAIGEQIRWNLTETCLALTIFRTELDVATALMFLVLVLAKCLHWSVELRGGHLRMTEEVFVYPHADEDEEDGHGGDGAAARTHAKPARPWHQRLPRLRLAHLRFYSLVNILLVLDIAAVAYCAVAVADQGPSVHILFGFEAAILLSSALSCLGSYHLHVVDGCVGALCHWVEGEHHHHAVGGLAPDADDADNNDGGTTTAAAPPPPASLARRLMDLIANPWRDRRATLGFAVELQAQTAKFLFYLFFFAIVFTYYGMPINIFREVYVSYQQLRRRLAAFNKYRRLTHNMDARFESITDEEELERVGKICIICRDAMAVGQAKKLGCGHAFHAHCLREWLVQQQTCPTCRGDILASEARVKAARVREEEERRVGAQAERAAREAELATAAEELAGAAGAPAAPAVQPPPLSSTSSRTEAAGAAVRPVLRRGAPPATTTAAAAGPDMTRGPFTLPTSADAREAASARRNPDQSPVPPSAAGRVPYNHEAEKEAARVKRLSDQSPLPPSAPATPAVARAAPIIPVQPSFPCLFRVKNPKGAHVLAFELPHKLVRKVPTGKIIVCISAFFPWEKWTKPIPANSEMVFYRISEGYVAAGDLEQVLELNREGKTDTENEVWK